MEIEKWDKVQRLIPLLIYLYVSARITAFRGSNLVGGTLSDNLATTLATLGTDIYNPVGNANNIEVVLYDNCCITAVDKAVDNIQQLAYILEMETRGGLIEDVECATRLALGELRSELDALRLATRKRGAGLTQGQVAQANLLNSL